MEKELRIGNYVGMFLKESPENIFEVLEVGRTMKVTDNLKTKSNAEFYDIEDLEPIPLTNDWLKELGFLLETGTPADSNSVYADFTYSVMGDVKPLRIYCGNNRKNYSLHLNASEGWFPAIKYFKYVHELQNLYYAITGRELSLAVTAKNNVA